MGLVRRNVVVLLGGAAMTVLAGVPQVAAQDAKVNGKFVTLLERLVIGAGAPKIATDTPQAVTVVDQADLDSKAATTTRDALSGIPSVTVIGSDRVLGEAFNIRGIGATDSSSDGSRIIVTVDGAPKFNEQYRMGSFFSDPELYKQIEVLRGPASSTLYGSGAIGGVINFTTKDASDFIREGYNGAIKVKGQVESNGQGTLASVLMAQRINETFDLLATGNFRRSNDFDLANGTVLSGSAFESWSGLVKGTARFGENDEEVLRLSYQRWKSGGNDMPYAQTGTASYFGTVDRDVTDDTVVLSYENPAASNPWLDLNASLSFSNTQNHQRNASGSGDPSLDADVDYAYTTYQLKADNTIDTVMEGFENHFTFGGLVSRQNRVAGKPNGGGPTLFHPEGVENKAGIFVQNESVWDDRITVIAGARVDFHDMQPSSSIPGASAIQGVAFSPKIASIYALTDNINVFSSLAHTERFPTLDELFSTQAAGMSPRGPLNSRTASLNLRPEQANNFEVGFSASAYDVAGLENSLTVKTTAFYNDLTDLIATTAASAPNGSPYYTNINKARIYGVEVEGAYDSDLFFGRLAYSLTKGQDATTGAFLDNIPASKTVLTVGARNQEWGLEYGVRATLTADPDRAVLDANNSRTTSKAYQKLDLFASWKPQEGPLAGTEAQFTVENVFNADYRDNLSVDRSKGRTFKLTLAKQFDY